MGEMATVASAAIVLVHGGFVDGSGWEGVYKILKKDGYRVSIVQNPTVTLEDDVAVTSRAIASQEGPVILVGHSYGGAVITEAGNDPKVVGLVYITAFAPDNGESVGTRHFELSTPFPSSHTATASSPAPAAIRRGEIGGASGGHKKVSPAMPPAINPHPSHLGRNVD